MPEELTLDGLTRDFKIWQRLRGHRHSTDDLLTAWYAVTRARVDTNRVLELGSGIGSIGLAVIWFFREATLTAVEVQTVSFELLEKNIAENRVGDRVRAIHGDLRHAVPSSETFDLVIGSPPYFPEGTGIISDDSQRAAARFELHGDVGDYCRIAKKALEKDGVFVFCFPTVQKKRAEKACQDTSLAIRSTRDVIPRKGADALFTLFACTHEGHRRDEPDYVVRDEAGEPTEEHRAARAVFGF